MTLLHSYFNNNHSETKIITQRPKQSIGALDNHSNACNKSHSNVTKITRSNVIKTPSDDIMITCIDQTAITTPRTRTPRPACPRRPASAQLPTSRRRMRRARRGWRPGTAWCTTPYPAPTSRSPQEVRFQHLLSIIVPCWLCFTYCI